MSFEEIRNHPRYEKFRQWQSGFSGRLHGDAVGDVLKEFPSEPTRQFSGWSSVWPRPTRHNWPYHENLFDTMAAAWDRDDENEKARAADQAKRDQEKADAAAELKAADDARRAADAEQVKAEIKQRYMSLPGTTLAGFEKEYPAILEEHRRQQLADGHGQMPPSLNSHNAF